MNFRNQLLESFPDSSPDSGIAGSVERKASEIVAHSQRAKRVRRTVIGAAATMGLIVVGTLVGPTALAVYKFKQIMSSGGTVSSVVMTNFAIDADGGSHPIGDIYYSKGLWRIERNGNVQVYSDGKLWNYEPAANRVMVQKKPNGPFSFTPSGFTVNDMLSDQARWNWGMDIHTSTEKIGGKTYDQVVLTDKDRHNRSIVLADQATHLPVEIRGETLMTTGWVLSGRQKLAFNVPIDQKLFSTSFGANVRVVSLDQLQEDWAKKLDTTIKTFKVADQQIDIRSIEINDRGHIFILYTDGETVQERQRYAQSMRRFTETNQESDLFIAKHPKPEFEVEDSSGVTYRKSRESFQPYVGAANGVPARGLVLKNGLILQGAWLVPSEIKPIVGRRLNVKVQLTLDDQTSKGSMALNARNSIIATLPDWTVLTPLCPNEVEDLYKEERNYRIVLNTERENWEGVVADLRVEVQAMEDKAHKEGYSLRPDIYRELAAALQKAGHSEEAARYKKLADAVPVIPNAAVLAR